VDHLEHRDLLNFFIFVQVYSIIKLFDFYRFWLNKDRYGNFERPENYAC
jgi:hypothetical protein